MKSKPGTFRRFRDFLLDPSPPAWMSSGVLFLVGVGLLAYFGPVTPNSTTSSTMRVQTLLAPGGTWSSPPVPGQVGHIDATIFVHRRAYALWTADEYSIFISSASANGAPISTSQVLGVWHDRLNAGDTRWASSQGDPLTIPEQKAVLDLLSARETARAATGLGPGVAPASTPNDPLSIVNPPYMRWVSQACWLLPLMLVITSIILAVGRAGQRATIRSRFLRLTSGFCPECGYSRSGINERAVCPECGEDPADARAAALRAMRT
jgi:hypothetical protein